MIRWSTSNSEFLDGFLYRSSMANTPSMILSAVFASIIAAQGMSYASSQGQKPIVGQYEAYNAQEGPAQP